MQRCVTISLVLLFVIPLAAQRVAGQCSVPDAGGTADLPPDCEYVGPYEYHRMNMGLPFGASISANLLHHNFSNIMRNPGGSLGGEVEQFNSELEIELIGLGLVSSYSRTLQFQAQCEVHTGPRSIGSPVQTFANDMYQLQGQLPSGDPDFSFLQITAGTALGMSSPGQTTLTQLPSGDWSVDSYFNINYQISFVGAAGGPFAGFAGTSSGAVQMAVGASANFFEDFDGYSPGSSIAGQGTWNTWDAVPLVDAPVSSAQAFSPGNSLLIAGSADIVRVFTGITTGAHVVSAMTYVPSSQTGTLWFILLNTYAPGGPYDWSVQLSFSATSGIVSDLGGSVGGPPIGGTTPLITDLWVPVRVEIDLDNNLHSIFYNNVPLRLASIFSGGANELRCIDLYSQASSESYFDDVRVEISGSGPSAPQFRRGDVNRDGAFNIADAVSLLSSLFGGAPAPSCAKAADANDDGSVNIADAVTILNRLFVPGSPLLPAPGPTTCGPDPTADALTCVTGAPCP
ncbi:MAG: dockerin type I repeat-containing protein [Planctomycetota bacterium]